MIGPEELQALDLLIWQRTGQQAAALCHCNQSTISRRVAHVLKVFDLRLQRVGREWQLSGFHQLLAMERLVHQHYRLAGHGPLRLEVGYIAAPLLATPPPPGWTIGPGDRMGRFLPLAMLEQGVIDAWITSSPIDLPSEEAMGCVVVPLNWAPVWLMASADHPLNGIRGIRRSDLDRFPSLALPEGWYPHMESVLRGQGLWTDPVRMARYDRASWDGRTADGVTLTYATPLMASLNPALHRLEWDLGFRNGEALVVRRDLAEHPAIAVLLEDLRRRVQRLVPLHPELEAVAA